MSEHWNTVQRQRERLREQHPELFDRMAQILYDRDPIGIGSQMEVEDLNEYYAVNEYYPEVGAILPRLKEARSPQELQKIIYEEFMRLFEYPRTVGPESRYETIAKDTWRLWQYYQAKHPGVEL